MAPKTWINYLSHPDLVAPVAIVGSPGLRSIGNIVVAKLANNLKAELFAELCSIHFPLIHHTKPSYVSDPDLLGDVGIKVSSAEFEVPKINFYYTISPPSIITRGYHANFYGQYEVAEKTISLYEKFRVKKILVLAGYGTEGRDVCCAASDADLIEEMKEEYGIEPSFEGPFYGFSGLVFGMAKSKGIKALCLFGRTTPNMEDPEYPDEDTALELLKYITPILQAC